MSIGERGYSPVLIAGSKLPKSEDIRMAVSRECIYVSTDVHKYHESRFKDGLP